MCLNIAHAQKYLCSVKDRNKIKLKTEKDMKYNQNKKAENSQEGTYAFGVVMMILISCLFMM